MKTQVTIRDVDQKTFQEFKAAAAKSKMTIGGAFNMAIHTWLDTIKKPKLKLTEWKSVSWGKGSERISEQVDDILYGGQ